MKQKLKIFSAQYAGRALFLGAIGIVTAVYNRDMFDPVLIPKYVFITGLCLIFIILSLFLPHHKNVAIVFHNSRWLWFGAAYLVISGISLFYTSSLQDGFFEWSVAVSGFGFLLLCGALNLKQRIHLQLLASAMTVFTLVILLLGGRQYLTMIQDFGISHHHTYLVSSIFGHKNIFSEVLLLSLPFNIYSAVKVKQKPMNVLAVAAILGSLVFIVVLLSRGVWVGLMGSVIFGISLIYFRKHKPGGNWKFSHRTKIIGIVSIVLMISSGWFFAKNDQQDTFEKQITSITNLSHSATEDRIGLWKRSVELFLEKPFSGQGTGSWKMEIYRTGTRGLKSATGETAYIRPHNDYLWVLSENGWPGLLAYMGFLLMAIAKNIKAFLKARNDSLLFLLTAMGLVAYLLIAGISFPKERIEHHILFSFLLLPLILYESSHNMMILPKNRMAGIGGMSLLLLLMVAGMIVGVKRMEGEKHVMKGIKYMAKKNVDRAIDELMQVDLDFLPLDHTGTPVEYYRGKAFMQNFQPKYGCSEYQRGHDFHPYHPQLLAGLGECYKLSGQLNKAEEFYQRSLTIAPFNSLVLAKLSLMYLEQKRYEDASKTIRIADPRYQHPAYDQAVDAVANYEIRKAIQQTDNLELTNWLLDSTIVKPNFNHVFRESVFNQKPFARELLDHLKPN